MGVAALQDYLYLLGGGDDVSVSLHDCNLFVLFIYFVTLSLFTAMSSYFASILLHSAIHFLLLHRQLAGFSS
jgi:hypothetical protein